MCDCFSAALRISTSLNEACANLMSTSFRKRLEVAREGIAVCKQYAACQKCRDPAQFTMFVIIARQTTTCLGQRSQGFSKNDEDREMVKVRIGSFETKVAMELGMQRALARAELQQLYAFLPNMLQLFGNEGLKATQAGLSETAASYQRQLVKESMNDILAMQEGMNSS